MGMSITATFYESWLRSIGSLPMVLMGTAILELQTIGEDELAKELMRLRQRWAEVVARRAKEAVTPDRLQRVGEFIEASLVGPERPRPVLTFPVAGRDARALPRRMEVADAG